jgi:hypothetical protein
MFVPVDPTRMVVPEAGESAPPPDAVALVDDAGESVDVVGDTAKDDGDTAEDADDSIEEAGNTVEEVGITVVVAGIDVAVVGGFVDVAVEVGAPALFPAPEELYPSSSRQEASARTTRMRLTAFEILSTTSLLYWSKTDEEVAFHGKLCLLPRLGVLALKGKRPDRLEVEPDIQALNGMGKAPYGDHIDTRFGD